MAKSQSQTIKDYLIKNMSISMNIPIKTIEAVVSNQFEQANKALHDNSSIEISGFCKFFFNKKKALKEYQKQVQKVEYFTNLLNKAGDDQKKINSLTIRITNAQKYVDDLKPKLERYEIIKCSGGMEEQAIPGGADEGANRQDLSGKNGDM